MPKPNYSYAKRQREIAKKQKKEEKRRQKALATEEAKAEDQVQPEQAETPPSDTES